MNKEVNNLVSIIVPVYNTDFSQLRKCITSLIEQTYQYIEILLVNDGSSNGFEKICEEFSKVDNRVLVINKENGGVSSTRNYGLDNCNGKFVMFVDSDDWIEINTVETAINAIEDNDFLVFNYSRDYSDNKKDIVIDKRDNLIFSDNNQEFYPFDLKVLGSSCAKLYLKSFIGDTRYNINLTNGEDCEFNNRLFSKLNKCKYINYVAYHYIQNDDSSVRKIDNNIINKYLKTIEEFRKTMLSNENVHTINTYYSFTALAYLMIILNYIFCKRNQISLKERLSLHNSLYEIDSFKDMFDNIEYVLLPTTRKVFIYFFKYRLPLVNYLLIKVKELVK